MGWRVKGDFSVSLCPFLRSWHMTHGHKMDTELDKSNLILSLYDGLLWSVFTWNQILECPTVRKLVSFIGQNLGRHVSVWNFGGWNLCIWGPYNAQSQVNQSDGTNRKVKLKFWLISHSKIMTPPVHQFNCDRNKPVQTPPVLQVSSWSLGGQVGSWESWSWCQPVCKCI